MKSCNATSLLVLAIIVSGARPFAAQPSPNFSSPALLGITQESVMPGKMAALLHNRAAMACAIREQRKLTFSFGTRL